MQHTSDAAPADPELRPAESQDEQEQTAEQAVFQFDETRVDNRDDQEVFASSGEVVVQLSDELEAALPEGGAVAVDHFVLSATAFSTGVCRLDVEIAYADGGLEYLSEPRSVWLSSGASADDMPTHWYVMRALTGEDLMEHEVVDAVPGDDEIERNTQYLTEDFSHMTVVRDCDDDFIDLAFTYSSGPLSADPGTTYQQIPAFAEAEVAVASGTQGGGDSATIVVTGSTDAELSVTGEWAPPSAD